MTYETKVQRFYYRRPFDWPGVIIGGVAGGFMFSIVFVAARIYVGH